MTRTELHNLLDDTVVYDVYKMLKSIGGDCKCSVDEDMVPHLSIDTGDDQLSITLIQALMIVIWSLLLMIS